MCTVSFLPKQEGDFILTSNRDESPDRHAIHFEEYRYAHLTLYYPKDPVAGGTWFCISPSGRIACLLNGAFTPFKPSSRYFDSRGTMVLESFKYDSLLDFIDIYAFQNTAPFTLVTWQNGKLHQLIWDGSKKDYSIIDSSCPHFWSSVTLYPENVRLWRKSLFNNWLDSHKEFLQEEIMDFHRYGGKGDEANDFVMNRDEEVKTLSISSVEKINGKFNIRHVDLSADNIQLLQLEIHQQDAPFVEKT
jgi:hypothetical protein